MILKNAVSHATFRADKMGKADLTRGDHLFAGLNAFEPGQEHAPHVHCDRDKMYVVLEGRGDVTVGEQRDRIAPGDVVMAPANVEHALRNPGPERLVVLVVMGPPPSSEK